MTHRLLTSHRASLRLAAASRWLDDAASRRLVVAANAAAAAEVTRRAAARHGGSFGWDRFNLQQLAEAVAEPVLARRRLAPAKAVSLDAVAARAVARLRREGRLGRFAPVADRLGLPQAVARTMREVRLAGLGANDVPGDLGALGQAFADELVATHLADPADVLAIAAEHLDAGGPWPWQDVPALWVDLAVRFSLEARFLAALGRRQPVLALAPTADRRSVDAIGRALGVVPDDVPLPTDDGLARLQSRLFEDPPPPAPPSDDVVLLSAPGEDRECTEIARQILDNAAAGVPFDRMAVLCRAPIQYRVALEEVFARAGIPVWWSQGTRLPDPAGRAFLALLACKAERYSARRFAEYASLGEVPVPEGDERVVPRRWEQLLVDAAVIGGLDRWRRRLDGLEATLRAAVDAQADDAPGRDRDLGRLAQLSALRERALPLLDRLAALPTEAPWRDWLAGLRPLAEAALRDPARVLDVLDALHLMGPVPVGLAEVRHVLTPHLLELSAAPPAKRHGRVFVGTLEAARGLDFDVVFVPGLAERILPAKVAEDPLFLDRDRRGLPLDTNADRVAAERLLLRLGVGAAARRVVLSWPRLEHDQLRPRVPSFYALEVVRAVEGVVPTFQELTRRADQTGAARIGWPAPSAPERAIDDAEYDLAVLHEVLHGRGGAGWLLGVNPHLARSLRQQETRWDPAFHRWDGLFAPDSPAALEVLGRHHPTRASWSATTLERYAACPYRMYLQGIVRLAPREAPVRVDRLDPMTRGSLLHELMFRVLVDLRDAGAPPVVDRDAARPRAERILDEVVARWHDDLHPAIDRVWTDEIARVRSDLLEWVDLLADPDWTPWRFELAFGLPGYARSDADRRPDPVTLGNGLVLRGAIDLIERGPDGALRVTDFKTGKARGGPGAVVRGGRTLQPLLYALACEALFPGATVDGARLWHVTHDAGFEDVPFSLEDGRDHVDAVVAAIAEDVAAATLPAAPIEGECDFCAYRTVCGSAEVARVARKAPLARLDAVRNLP